MFVDKGICCINTKLNMIFVALQFVYLPEILHDHFSVMIRALSDFDEAICSFCCPSCVTQEMILKWSLSLSLSVS